MSRVTGLFVFKMKLNGEEHPTTVEIRAPGILSQEVMRLVRGEWANLIAPSASQNRIECLGWEPIEAAPSGAKPVKAIGPEPIFFWRASDR